MYMYKKWKREKEQDWKDTDNVDYRKIEIERWKYHFTI